MKLSVTAINREAFGHFDDAIRNEWLNTNGLCGYASSTVLGVYTREYHGWLVAALNPPVDRTLCPRKAGLRGRGGKATVTHSTPTNSTTQFSLKDTFTQKNLRWPSFPRYIYKVQDSAQVSSDYDLKHQLESSFTQQTVQAGLAL